MKKRLIIILVVLLAITAIIFSACDKKGVEEQYTLVFNSNGGSQVASIETDGKSAIDMPNPPTKEGYIFEGWYLDDGVFDKPFNEDSFIESPINKDTTVYAKWK